MTRQPSTSYEQLEHEMTTEFDPDQLVWTNLVLTDASGADPILDELDDLIEGAVEFGVTISTMFNNASLSAIIVLSGTAKQIGLLAAYMDGAEIFCAS